MSISRLPEFIVVGAAKAATTWIAHHLRERPDVFLPGPEPHFFSRFYDRGFDWYAKCFSDAQPGQKIGEKSADYLAHPDVPARLATAIPAVRLIVQLRNPIERAYSDYCMFYRRGTVGSDVERQLRAGTAQFPRFLEDGLYHRHLSRFLDHFPREQIEIVLYDDIRERPQQVIARLESHLALEPSQMAMPLDRRMNDSEAPLLPLAMRRLLRPAKPIFRRFRGRPWLEGLRRQLARPVRYPPLSGEVRAYLTDYYAEDVDRLSGLLQRDLHDWLAPAAEPG